MKLNPPLESRRVRTQPWSRTCRPTASTRRDSAKVHVSIKDHNNESQKPEIRNYVKENPFVFFRNFVCRVCVFHFFFCIFAHVSRSVTALLNTDFPGF